MFKIGMNEWESIWISEYTTQRHNKLNIAILYSPGGYFGTKWSHIVYYQTYTRFQLAQWVFNIITKFDEAWYKIMVAQV